MKSRHDIDILRWLLRFLTRDLTVKMLTVLVLGLVDSLDVAILLKLRTLNVFFVQLIEILRVETPATSDSSILGISILTYFIVALNFSFHCQSLL